MEILFGTVKKYNLEQTKPVTSLANGVFPLKQISDSGYVSGYESITIAVVCTNISDSGPQISEVMSPQPPVLLLK